MYERESRGGERERERERERRESKIILVDFPEGTIGGGRGKKNVKE
jgi:hypothetical protein